MDRDSVISAVRANAGIATSEYDDTRLGEWADTALKQHNRKYEWATTPAHEFEPVMLLAWIQVCRARAGKATQYFSVNGREGSTNKAEIVNNSISLIRELREEYKTACGRLGINPSPEIIVSDITVMDESSHGLVPITAHTAPQVSTLYISNITSSTVDLRWDACRPATSFLRYVLYYGTTPTLKDDTNIGDTISNPGVADHAVRLQEFTNITHTAARITGLTEGTAYYFIVVVEDVNALYSISNEVSNQDESEEAESETHSLQLFLSGTLTSTMEYATALTFAGQSVTITRMLVTVQTPPSTGALQLQLYREANGAGASFEVSVALGQSSGSNSGSFTVESTQALYLRTGTAGGAAGATVIIEYTLEA